MSEYPEHEKIKALGERRDAVQEVLDWLLDEKRYVLAKWDDSDGWDRLEAVHPGREKLMAEFFGIDLAKIETEKRAMLDALRAANEVSGG